MGEGNARRHERTEARRGRAILGAVALLATTACSGASPEGDGRGRTPVAEAVAGIGVGADAVATAPAPQPPPSSPTPAVISFVMPALGAPPPAPTPVNASPPETGPAAPAAVVEPAIPPGILVMSGRIEAVMTDLDRLVDASLQLQYSLLRLRLRPKQTPPPVVNPPDPDSEGL